MAWFLFVPSLAGRKTAGFPGCGNEFYILYTDPLTILLQIGRKGREFQGFPSIIPLVFSIASRRSLLPNCTGTYTHRGTQAFRILSRRNNRSLIFRDSGNKSNCSSRKRPVSPRLPEIDANHGTAGGYSFDFLILVISPKGNSDLRHRKTSG